MNNAAATVDDVDVYEISVVDAEIPAAWSSGAIYRLELPVRCPYCPEPIRSVRIVALTQAQAPSTSTPPSRGRVVICGECERILSADLSSMM